MVNKEIIGDVLITIYGDNKSDIDRKKKELRLMGTDAKKNSNLDKLPFKEKK